MAVINFPVFPSFYNAQFIWHDSSCIQKGKGEIPCKKKKPNQKNEKYYHVLKVQHFSNVFIEVSLKSYRFNFNLLDSLINMFKKDVLR